ncbi:MAG: helix-turn-helix transcriptional regulator [Bdellovibrionales bacterium]|nr:helix-turn-helix transcriptional regulator [Bdellovibrionales bacterium]
MTQAETLDELRKNMAEVLNTYLDEPESSRQIFPLPGKYRGQNIEKVAVQSNVLLAMIIRMARLRQNLTQKKVADRMGVKLYAYQRLESSKHVNPTWTTIQKLVQAIPKFPKDLLLEALS